MIAALFVEPSGIYSTFEGVELWGLPDRDARDYAGPHRVIAHPPCARWGRLSKQVEWSGGKKVGDDDGCFEAALNAVRKWGGVLEHPAHSYAWAWFGLTRPTVRTGWVRADWLLGHKGWTCQVDQWHYGHRAKKSTWLYAIDCDLPSLQWEPAPADEIMFTITASKHPDRKEFKNKKERIWTPPEFAKILVSMAKNK